MDLAAYLARVGQPRRPPGVEALGDLHEAHVRTFPFDNIDVLLEQHPGVEPEDVEAKLVGRGRGGYCFEHATLFWLVLRELGYDAERRLGRVGDVTASARTHCVLTVRLEGRRWLADPGFGLSLLHPVPLEDGAVEECGGWAYQVRRLTTQHPLAPGELESLLHELGAGLTRVEVGRLLAVAERLPAQAPR